MTGDPSESLSSRQRTVIVAEAIAPVRLQIADGLRRAGFRVQEATSVGEARMILGAAYYYANRSAPPDV